MHYKHDLREWVNSLPAWIEKHRLDGVGRYCRYAVKEGRASGTGLDPYGCADAANILYTIGEFPTDIEERKAWVKTLQSFQDKKQGSWQDPTHSRYHTTAHCTAALELLDARPAHPLTFLEPLKDRKNLDGFLDKLNWAGDPWRMSHDGAGCCAAFAITDSVPQEWYGWYFSWLDHEVDPYTGFWRKGCSYAVEEWPGLFGSMAAGFHYHFNYEHFHVPMPYSDKVVDTCLLIFEKTPHKLGTAIGFAEIDWVFCLNRALRQTDHRRDEAVDALWVMCERMVKKVNDPATRASRVYDDLHSLFGTVCAVAELQQALPGSILTPKPLKLVLDRRPFI